MVPCPRAAATKFRSLETESTTVDNATRAMRGHSQHKQELIAVVIRNFPFVSANRTSKRKSESAFVRRDNVVLVGLSDVRPASKQLSKARTLQTKPSDSNLFPNLPDDCLIVLFTMLLPKELGVISCACRSWRRCVHYSAFRLKLALSSSQVVVFF